MKKRKKNGTGRQDDSQQPDVSGSEMDLSGIEISQLSDAELEALTAPEPSMEEPEMEEFAMAALESAGALDVMEPVDIPEPEMDELLAELLAQEPAMEMSGDLGEEAMEAELVAALPEELPLEMAVDFASTPPVEFAAEPDPEPKELVPEPVELSLEAAAIELPIESLIPEPELPAEFLLSASNDDPVAEERETMEMRALSAAATYAKENPTLESEPVEEPVAEPVEAAAVEAIAPAEVEIPAEPAPPQPALEAVVRSIDQALESAPQVASVAEPASPAHHHKQFSQLDDYVVFTLSGTDYAVPVRDVAEIGRIPSITRLPNVPDFIRGITNLRGEVVPVLSLPTLLGLQDAPATARGRVLFLQPRERVSSTGLVVDEVKGIQRIQSQQLEQVTGLVDDKVTQVLRGVHGRGDRLLNVLDLEQLFHLQEFQQLETR